MCGQANCVPFGCVIGEAIEHVGAGNIIIGLSFLFGAGAAFGYMVAMKRARARYVQPTLEILAANEADANREVR